MGSDNTMEANLNNLRDDVGDMRGDIRALTEAVTRLAVVEERQAQSAEALNRAFSVIDDITKRIRTLEMEGQVNKQTSLWVDRSVVALVTGAVMFIVKKLGIV